jgi:hypothetical protein
MGNFNCKNSRLSTDMSLGMKSKPNPYLTSSFNNSNNFNNLNAKRKNPSLINSLDKVNLVTFHQNICGLRKNTNKILCHLSQKLPHVLCFTEHHLTSLEFQSVFIGNFTRGAYYCRKYLQKGGVCIYVNNNIISSCLHLERYCIDGVIEVHGVKFKFQGKKICLLSTGHLLVILLILLSS